MAACTEAEKRHKRAHWKASSTLIERHRGEFDELLAREKRAQEPAR